MKISFFWILVLPLVSVFFVGCTDKEEEKRLAGKSETQVLLYKKGKAIFQGICVACHNSDPTKPGSLAPILAGASEDLLKAKVLTGKYPDGYTPRQTKGSITMPLFPQYEKDIPALHEYLNSMN